MPGGDRKWVVAINRIGMHFRSISNKNPKQYQQKIINKSTAGKHENKPKESQNGTKIDANTHQKTIAKLITKNHENLKKKYDM